MSDTFRFDPVGRCIYCGTQQPSPGQVRFGDEHILPLGLNGKDILPQASCDVCARIINREIEEPFMHQRWGVFRAKNNMATRRKNARKNNQVIWLDSIDGTKFPAPVLEYPAPVIHYSFDQARILSGKERAPVSYWAGLYTYAPPMEEHNAFVKKYPEWNQQFSFQVHPDEFARLLAKMTYARTIAMFGYGSYEEKITPIILGKDDDVHFRVGGNRDGIRSVATLKENFRVSAIGRDLSRLNVIVDCLFVGNDEQNNYHVVVGELDYYNPVHQIIMAKHFTKSGKID